MRLAKRRALSGFTLMELLIVVIIIGILATLALPQFTKFVDQSRESEATNNIGSGLSAQFTYFQEKGVFTTNTSDLSFEFPRELKYWTLPGTAPNYTWTTGNADLTELNATAIQITATSNARHGHADPTTHQIKGGIDLNGKRVIKYKRPGDATWKEF